MSRVSVRSRLASQVALCCRWLNPLGIFCAISACASAFPLSDHCDGTRFANLDPAAPVDRSLVELLRWKLSGQASKWPTWCENTNPYAPVLPLEPGSVAVTAINHATELIQSHGMTVLTDPVFAWRVSPLQWVGPKRARPPGIALHELPPIDVIVISHNHYDHLDLGSLRSLAARGQPLFVVPLGNGSLLRSAGISRVVELDWWQSYGLGQGKCITLVPAQHWSGRGLFDRRKTLWGGYVIQDAAMQVFFAGDTGFAGHFESIRQRFGPMDLALLPIGAYAPRWFLHAQHMNPEEAVRAHQILGARKSVGMHFGTFQLTDEDINAPIQALAASLQEHQIPAADFVALRNGQTFFIAHQRVAH